MDELLEHFNEKRLDGIEPVSISMSPEYFSYMRERGIEPREICGWRDICNWCGVPVHEAKHLHFGYIIHWSDGTYTLRRCGIETIKN
jgi:hypothetical protein